MSIRNKLALGLIILSLFLLYPGLTKNILSITIGVEVPLLGSLDLHDSTQSIMGTIKTLHKNDNSFVAFLILFFSVLIPIIKAVILLAVLLIKSLKNRAGLHKFVSLIGKWSMADVFVVGVFIAYLSTQSDANVESKLHEGFYYFLGYCIVSMIAYQIMDVES